MPLARIEVARPLDAETRRALVLGVKASLADGLEWELERCKVRLQNYDTDDFSTSAEDGWFAVIVIHLVAGRSDEKKKRVVEGIFTTFTNAGFARESVEVAFVELPPQSWAYRGTYAGDTVGARRTRPG
jgi:phenylpyruvate tautomerase PptA (4-oxalocrotonate tautomerase family)